MTEYEVLRVAHEVGRRGVAGFSFICIPPGSAAVYRLIVYVIAYMLAGHVLAGRAAGRLAASAVAGTARDDAGRDARGRLRGGPGRAARGRHPIGAALFHADGKLLGRGHNRRVQHDDPSIHGETDAFRSAGRQRTYRDTTMATTLSPCWYCSGLVRQFGIGRVVIGESVNFRGGQDWLAEHGVEIVELSDQRCSDLLAGFIARHPSSGTRTSGSTRRCPRRSGREPARDLQIARPAPPDSTMTFSCGSVSR